MIDAAPGAPPPDWPRAGDEIGAQNFGPFAQEALARYAAVSGDDNPLHLDPEAAKAAGLAGPPVHGMLMLSCFEPLIMGWRRDLFISRLSAKFLRPVLAGQAFELSGRVMRVSAEVSPNIILRLMVHGHGGDLSLVAEATPRPRLV